MPGYEEAVSAVCMAPARGTPSLAPRPVLLPSGCCVLPGAPGPSPLPLPHFRGVTLAGDQWQRPRGSLGSPAAWGHQAEQGANSFPRARGVQRCSHARNAPPLPWGGTPSEGGSMSQAVSAPAQAEVTAAAHHISGLCCTSKGRFCLCPSLSKGKQQLQPWGGTASLWDQLQPPRVPVLPFGSVGALLCCLSAPKGCSIHYSAS